jgi:hypothetical protein
MIIHGAGQRDQDRGAPRTGQFGQRGCASASDDEVRPAQLFGHIVEIGGEIGGNFQVRVDFAHPLDIFGTTLLRHLQAAAQAEGQHAESVRHDR